MMYDLIAAFYTKESANEPRYRVPLGTVSYSSLEGFDEDPDSTPGYTDYILRNATGDDLQQLTRRGYISEAADVLYSGVAFERIDIQANELDTLDDEGTIAPRGLMIGNVFIKFTETEPLSPVYFIEGDPFEMTESTRVFQVPLKKLKDYFEDTLTMFEVMDHFRRYFTDLSHWSFEEFKDYFESGIDDAVDLATRTFFRKQDMDGNPEILHALTVGMAGKTKYEKIVGFLHDVVEDSDTTLDDLRTYGYSDEVIDALALLTHDKKAISYNDYIFNIGFSNNDLAINVKITDLKHNIARGKAGHHRKLVKKHEDALAALLDYKEGKAHVIKEKS